MEDLGQVRVEKSEVIIGSGLGLGNNSVGFVVATWLRCRLKVCCVARFCAWRAVRFSRKRGSLFGILAVKLSLSTDK